MVNAGAILVLSLLLNLSEVDMSLAEKFDWVMNYFKVSPALIIHLTTTRHPRTARVFVFVRTVKRPLVAFACERVLINNFGSYMSFMNCWLLYVRSSSNICVLKLIFAS